MIPFVWNSVQDQMKDHDGKQNSDSPGPGWEGRLTVMGRSNLVLDPIFSILIVIVLIALGSTLFKTHQIVCLNWEILMNANFTLIKAGPNKWTKENEEKLSMSLSGKENYFSENSHIMTKAPMRVSFCQVGEYEIIEQLVSGIVAPVRSEVLEVTLIGLKSKEMNTK